MVDRIVLCLLRATAEVLHMRNLWDKQISIINAISANSKVTE
jgi:hypothetical protein